jgi:MSHA biogenesis protein MshI
LKLFTWLNRRRRDHRLAGVAFDGKDVSLACIRRGAGRVPVLETCRAIDASDDPWKSAESLVDGLRLSRCPASVLVPPGNYQLLLVEAPDVPPEELRAAVRWRIKDLINFHVDDAIIDVFEIPDQKRQAGRLMYAVAARAPRVRESVDGARAAGLRLEAVDIPEMAVRNLAGLLDGDERGMATLYLGARRGMIVISRQGTLFLARAVELGQEQLAEAAEGERAGMIEVISLEVQRSLDYYDSHFSQRPVSGLAVLPTAAELPFLAEGLRDALGLTLQEVDLNELIECDSPLEPAEQARSLLAIGAALRREERAL